MIKVAIVDDHELVRDGFCKLIDTQGDLSLVGQVSNAQGVMEILKSKKVDVLVLDISLPDKDGIEVLKDIKAEKIPVKVIVLSMHPEHRFAKRAFENGASCYLTKDYASRTIARAIRKVYLKGTYLTGATARQLYPVYHAPDDIPPHQYLSDREYQVFLLISEGLTPCTITEKLGISKNTVNTHRKRILEKMGFSKSTDIIRYAVKHNLI